MLRRVLWPAVQERRSSWDGIENQRLALGRIGKRLGITEVCTYKPRRIFVIDSIIIVGGMVFGRKTGFHTQWGKYLV